MFLVADAAGIALLILELNIRIVKPFKLMN